MKNRLLRRKHRWLRPLKFRRLHFSTSDSDKSGCDLSLNFDQIRRTQAPNVHFQQVAASESCRDGVFGKHERIIGDNDAFSPISTLVWSRESAYEKLQHPPLSSSSSSSSSSALSGSWSSAESSSAWSSSASSLRSSSSSSTSSSGSSSASSSSPPGA